MSDIYNTQTQCSAARVAIRCAPSHPALAPEERRRSPRGILRAASGGERKGMRGI